MIDEAGEDPVEIEPAPDVAGDAAQGLGPMQEVRDLLLPTRDPDDRPDRIGEGRGQVRIGGAEPVPAIGAVRDHQQDAPRAVGARDGHRELAEGPGRIVDVTRSRPEPSTATAPGDGSSSVLAREVGTESSARPRTPNVRGRSSRRGVTSPAGTAAARGVRRSPRSSQSATSASSVAARISCAIRIRSSSRSLPTTVRRDDVVEQGEVAAVALRAEGIHAIGPGREARDRRAGKMSTGMSRVRLIVMPAGGSAATGAVGRDAFRGREEPLEVSQAIASIAPSVDPVVPQATRVAPCSDRVRVDAQKPRGFGDRQGRVCGSGRELRHHRGPVRTVKSTSGGYQPHSSCQ